ASAPFLTQNGSGVGAEQGIAVPGWRLNRRPRPGHRQSRSLGRGPVRAIATAQADRRGQLGSQGLDLLTCLFGAPSVVETIGLLPLVRQLRRPSPVAGLGAGVEEWAPGAAEGMRDFLRLFMAPGMQHCSGGPGPNTFDVIGALERWVEQRVAPDRI